MRCASWAWTAIRTAGLIVLCLAAGYVLLQSLSHFPGAPGEPVSAPPAAPTSAARDSLNRVVWIEGGIVLKGSHNPGKSENPASPYYTGDERPPDSTRVAGFWMQEHEVTNTEFRRFDPGHQFPEGRARHPVVDVTLPEAMEYAAAVGGRLPTEAEWELAAEGTENRMYPWGDSSPTCRRAQYAACDSPNGSIEVMSRPNGATPDGVHDLAGNVWEWVVPAWFEPGRTPVNDESRRLRGGSYRSPAFFLRASNRSNGFPLGFEGDDVGFRVVWPAD